VTTLDTLNEQITKLLALVPETQRQAAAALLVTAPVLLLTLLMQKEIVHGLTAGGVKGG